jgi:hypothetical protein
MSTTTDKFAIILHGPPAVGKTVISGEIQQRYPGAVRHISLDDGWARDEVRYGRGPQQYADLSAAPERILVIELASGEPPDLAFNGATRAAQQWVTVLQRSDRILVPFLLWLDWPDAVARLRQRFQNSPTALFQFWSQIGVYALYEKADSVATFPQIPGFRENRIQTTGRTVSDITDEILRTVAI